MAGKEETYLVRVTRPKEMSVREMEEYIDDAVSSWAGGCSPDHPLFGGNNRFYSVLRATEARARKLWYRVQGLKE